MRKLLTTIFLFSLCGVTLAEPRHHNVNVLIALEKSVEAVEFQMSNATGSGYIIAKECHTCKEVQLNVTANTQAFFNNKHVPLNQVPAIATSIITVVYDPKTMNATRITW